MKKMYISLGILLCGVMAYASGLSPSTLTRLFYSVASAVTRAGEESPVYNETTGVGYETLEEALTEITNGSDTEAVLILNEDQKVANRWIINKELDLTIKGGSDGIKLLRATPANNFLFGTSNGKMNLTIENLTVDGCGTKSSVVFFEVSSGSLNLKDVVFTDCHTSHQQGLIVCKASGHLNIENVRVENSEVPENRGWIFVGGDNVKFIGTNNVSSIYIEKAYHINVDKDALVSETGAVDIFVDSDRTEPVVVNGCVDPSKFTLANLDGNILVAKGSNLEMTTEKADDQPVYIERTVGDVVNKYGLDSFHSAHEIAIAEDVIVLNEDVTITHRVDFTKQDVTVKGAEGGKMKRITCSKDMIYFLSKAAAKGLTIENLVMDGSNESWNSTVFEVADGGSIYLKNVKIENYTSEKNEGLISVKSNNANNRLVAENLVVENCKVPDGYGDIFNGRNVELKGECKVSVYLENTNGQLYADELTNEEPIPVYVAASRKGSVIVNGCSDPSKFTVYVDGKTLAEDGEDYELMAVGNNLELRVNKSPEDYDVVLTMANGDKAGYDDLMSASKAASAGDVIVIKTEQTTDDRITGNLTVKGESSETPVTIKGNNDKILFIANSGLLTLENVVVDGSENASWGNAMIEVKGGQLALKNVTLQNYPTTKCVIDYRDTNGSEVSVENVVIDSSCSVADDAQIPVSDGKTLQMTGNNKFTVSLAGSADIEVTGTLTNSDPIQIIVDEARANTTIVKNCTDASKFALNLTDYKLEAKDGNLQMVTTKVVDPEESPVVNRTTKTGYTNLEVAFSNASDGDLIVVKEDQTISTRLSIENRKLTIQGNEGAATPVVIARAEGLKEIMFLANVNGGELNLENLTIDGAGVETEKVIFEASNNGHVNFTNVTLTNCKTTANQGLVCIKGGGQVVAENLVISNSSVAEGRAEIFVGGNSGLTIKGNAQFNVAIEPAAGLTVENLTNKTPISVILDESDTNKFADGDVIVNGTSDLTKFNISKEGCSFEAGENCIVLKVEKSEEPENPGTDPEEPEDPTVDPATKPVYNQTTNKGYDDFTAAFNAAATEDILIVNENQTISRRLENGDKKLTVKGKDGATTPVVITRTESYNGMLFLANTNGGELNLENLTIDGAGVESDKVILEASGSGHVNFTNVTLANCKSTANQGLVCIKGGGQVVAENLVISNSSVAEGRAEVFVGGNSGLTIKGNAQFNVALEPAAGLTVENLTNKTPISVILDESDTNKFADGDVIVNGTSDLTKFNISKEGCSFEAGENGIVLKVEKSEEPENPGTDPEEPEDPTVDPATKPVYNQTTNKGYDNFTEAFNKAATEDVLIVNENQTISSRLSNGDKKLTVKGKDGATTPVVIARAESYHGMLFLANTKGGELNLENLTIDGAGVESDKVILEAQAPVNFKNVTLTNCKSTANQGLVSIKSGGQVVAENLVISNSSVAEGRAEVFVGGNSGLTIKGNAQFNVAIEPAAGLSAENLTNKTPISVILDESDTNQFADGTVIVNGISDLNKFNISKEGYSFEAGDNCIVLKVEKSEEPENPGTDPENPGEDPENPGEDPENPGEDPEKPGEDPIVDQTTKPVYNQTTKTGYDDFTAAFNAAATEDILIINENQTISSRLSNGDKKLTVKGKEGSATPIKIARAESYNGMLFLANTNGGELNLENLTIDGAGVESDKVILEASGSGHVNFTNVTLTNCKSTANQGLVCIKGGGQVVAENLVISNSSVADGHAEIFVGNNSGLTIKGNAQFNVAIEPGAGLSAENLTNKTPISVILDEGDTNEFADGTVIVNGTSDLTKFNISKEGCSFEAGENCIVLKVEKSEEPEEPEDPTVDQTTKPIYNQTTNKGYDNFTEAFNKAATEDVLIVNENQTISSRISIGDKKLTVKGKEGSATPIKIARAESYNGMLFLANTNGGELNLENLTIDGAGVESDKVILEASGRGHVNFTNVTLANCKTTANQGLLCIKSGGQVVAENLVVSNSRVAEDRAEVFVGNNSGLTIKGNAQFNVVIEPGAGLTVENLSNKTPIGVVLDESAGNFTDGDVIVSGSSDLSKFNINKEGYSFVEGDNSIILKVEKTEDPENPGTDPENPGTDPENPGTDPENPGTDPENPGTDPDDPIVDQTTKPVYNQTSGKGFQTIAEAVDAAVTGDVIMLNDDQVIDSRINIGERELAFISEDNVTISRAENYKGILFLANANGGELTLENVTIDGAGVESDKVILEASGHGNINFIDVTITNCVSTANQGIVSIKSGSHVEAENLVITNSQVAAGRGEIFVGGNSSLTMYGECAFSLILEPTGSVIAEEATHTTPIVVMLDGERENPVIINGCDDVKKFTLQLEGYYLMPNNGNLEMKKNISLGVEEIDPANDEEDVEYYDLQSKRVMNPSHGIYIRRQGNTVTKVYIR